MARGGHLSGVTIAINNDEWYFNPGLLVGSATMFWSSGLSDSFDIIVKNMPWSDYSFCELSPAKFLQ